MAYGSLGTHTSMMRTPVHTDVRGQANHTCWHHAHPIHPTLPLYQPVHQTPFKEKVTIGHITVIADSKTSNIKLTLSVSPSVYYINTVSVKIC